MLVQPKAEPPTQSNNQKIRAMLVDDSAVVRGLIGRWLSAEDNMEVVARCHNGMIAVREVGLVKPSIIILDIEMPEMDGLEALPLLMAASPQSRILIASGLSTKNAQISMTALAKGAHDYIPKPSSNSGLTTSSEFRVELITKINALCVNNGGRKSSVSEFTAPRDSKGTLDHTKMRASRGGEGSVSSPATRQPSFPAGSAKQAGGPTAAHLTTRAPVRPALRPLATHINTAGGEPGLLPFKTGRPDVLCIGSSTGGPKAIHQLLTSLGPALNHVPVLLTQHMPKSFTTVFAEHLDKALSIPVHEAEDGMEILDGQVYVAPGDRHLVVRDKAGKKLIHLDDGPEVNFCKPAVDVMFASAAAAYRNKILSVILTGMGQDGVLGGREIVDAGGNVIAICHHDRRP